MTESRRIAWFSVASIAVIFLLSMFSAPLLEPFIGKYTEHYITGGDPDLFWAHIVTTGIYAVIVVLVFSGLMLGLAKRLQEKETELRNSEKHLRAFSADAAHELRTPLAVLRVQIESMDDNATAKILLQDVDRLTHIIEQVLDKSRFDVLQVMPDEIADLSAVCTDVASYVAPLVIKEGRSIEVIGTDQPTMVHGNAFALEQAVKNLVFNATKYSARGTTITVEVTGEPAVHVIDHGRGVPEAERDAIFERFHRADRRGGGSGLGLAIVKSVAEAHGGRVGVGDTPGGGAVFSITLNNAKKTK